MASIIIIWAAAGLPGLLLLRYCASIEEGWYRRRTVSAIIYGHGRDVGSRQKAKRSNGKNYFYWRQ